MLRNALILLCLVASPAAQDEAKALQSFQQAFKRAPGTAGAPVERRLEAVKLLEGLDSQRTAEAVVRAHADVEAETSELEAERTKANDDLAALVKGQEKSDHRTFPKPQHERYLKLQEQTRKLREQVDALRGLQEALGERIAAARQRDSLVYYVLKVLPDRKRSLQLKLAAAKALGAGANDALDELAAALKSTKETEDLLALLEAFVLAGKAARPHAAAVIQLLAHKEEAVRESAAVALSKIAVWEAIAPMIDVLDKSTGQSRQRVAAALEVLTDQQFGDNVGSWRAWFADQGKMFQASDKLGTGKASHKDAGGGGTGSYFGIPQHLSSSILYLIDCSGSMKEEIQLPGNDGKKTSRLEGCKKELIAALGRLRTDQKFGLLWYNDLPHLWEPRMQLATPEAVLRAQAFVATLQPASSTNIYDSLQQAFGLVGRGSKDKYYGVELDTVFLLTDGSPTTADGKLDSTEKIIAGVREWNPLKRVTIHCIAIGKGLNLTFLQLLAHENGGECKQY